MRYGGDGAPRVTNPNAMNVSRPPPAISDDDAMEIEAAVIRLMRRDGVTGRVIKAYFIENLPDERIAEILRVSRGSIATARHCGIFWIDGYLDSVELA